MKIFLFLGGLRPPKPSPLAGWFLEGFALSNPPRWQVVSWEGFALPDPPRWRVGSWEGVGARRRRAPTPKPSRMRAMFTSA